MIDVGRVVRRRRTELGLSVEQLMCNAGLSTSTGWRIERGGTIQLETLEMTAKALGVPLWMIIKEAEET